MTRPESPFEQVTRQGIEREIADGLAKKDERYMNAQLEIWPYGKFRTLGHVATGSPDDQPTEELPVITLPPAA